MPNDQKITETDFSIAIRSTWRRPADGRVLVVGAVILVIFGAFWPTSLKVLGLAGPPVACFGIAALAVAAARTVLETRLYISDIGLNSDVRALGFWSLKSGHVPRRQAAQAFVRADFSKKKPTRSLHLLLADGQSIRLLHGLEQAAAQRLEAKVEAILGIQNQPVAGEDRPQKGWAEGLFAYPEPLEEGTFLPASALFEVEKKGADRLVIREKIITSTRLKRLAELVLLLVVSIFLNGLIPLLWLLTTWPLVVAFRKIGWPSRLELGASEVVSTAEKNDGHPNFLVSELVSVLVAPDGARGFVVSSYQVLLVDRAGGRRAVWRDLPLEEAFFLEKQIKIWFGLPEGSALPLIQKVLEIA